VLVTVALLAIFFFLIDLGLSAIIDLIMGK